MRSMLSALAIAACFVIVIFVTSERSTRAGLSPQKADFATSLVGQKVLVYFSDPVHAPTPAVGSKYEITNSVLGNCTRGRLLALSDGWIELEMADDHRHVSVPIHSVGYLLTDSSPATQP
jgi:hypothetical protein